MLHSLMWSDRSGIVLIDTWWNVNDLLGINTQNDLEF